MRVRKKNLLAVLAVSIGLHSTSYALEDHDLLFVLAASQALMAFQQPFIEVTSTEAIYLREAKVLPLPDTQCMSTEIPGEQVCVGNSFPTRLRLQPDKNLKLGLHPLCITELNYPPPNNTSNPAFISDPLFLRQNIFPELNPEAKAIATEVLQGAEQQREIIKSIRQRVQIWPLRNPNVNLDEPEEENDEEDTDIKWWSLESEIDMAEDENDRLQIQHDDAILLEPDTRYCFSPDTGNNYQNNSQGVADNNSGDEADIDSGDEADIDSSVQSISVSSDPCPVSIENSKYCDDQLLKKIKVAPLSDEETTGVTVEAASSSHYEKSVRPHTDLKPYECVFDGCGKVFSLGRDLRAHLHSHPVEKPYECGAEGCSRAFSQKNHLVIHQRTHSVEKPYKCGTLGCSKVFSQKHDLRVHQRTHTVRRRQSDYSGPSRG